MHFHGCPDTSCREGMQLWIRSASWNHLQLLRCSEKQTSNSVKSCGHYVVQCLYNYINKRLLWPRKYARIVVRGYCLFREANSCLRAKLEGNCELRGTDNVQGQLFMHILEAKCSLLSLLSFKYFLSQRKPGRKTKQNKKQNTSTSWCFLALLSQQVSRISSSVNWRKMLHFEVCSPDGGYWLWAGIISW